MRDHLAQLVAAAAVEQRRNLAREYLQIYLLRLLHQTGAMAELAFVGGTALRILYQLPRFSEDLDFSFVSSTGSTSFDARGLFVAMKVELERAGYELSIRARLERTVANAFFRFAGLPKALGLSADPRLALSVKLEIDLSPPAGGNIETSLVQRFFPIALRHYGLPSLFAGKLHALMARRYTKGRDWFDLAWYLTEKRGLEPNEVLLQNALVQTRHTLPQEGWRHAIRTRLHSTNWAEVTTDLRPFLERQSDLDHLKPELIDKLLGP